MLPLAQNPNRTEQVYQSIRESICDCSLKPGTHLVQEDLAATLGVSRQPVQQAMLLLKNDGLVVEKGGRGLYVAPLNRVDMAHHYEIRIVLDQLAARKVAERAAADRGFAERLQAEGDRIIELGAGAAQDGSAAVAVDHDVRFHSMIYDFSGNPQIAPTLEAHWLFLRRVMIGVLLHAARGPLVWAQHREILDALVSGDVEASVALATVHVTGAQKALLATLDGGAAAAFFGEGAEG